jgi:hypothetical protein
MDEGSAEELVAAGVFVAVSLISIMAAVLIARFWRQLYHRHRNALDGAYSS